MYKLRLHLCWNLVFFPAALYIYKSSDCFFKEIKGELHPQMKTEHVLCAIEHVLCAISNLLTLIKLINTSDCAIRNCGPLFCNSLDKTVKHCKTPKHFINQLKSVLLSECNWFHLGHVLCIFVYFCLFVCEVYFFQVCLFAETFVKGMIVSGLEKNMIILKQIV